MTAHRITAERIAELKRHYPRGAYSPNREHHPFGHIAYSTIDIHELIDALESAYADLARLRSAPVAVEVPEPTDADWTMIKDQAESAGLEYPDGFYDGMAYARRNARTPSSPHIATSNKERYFWCDPEALDFHFTDTLEGARFQASNAIQSANEDCEDYEFKEDEKKICYGIVLGRAKEGHDSVDPEIPVLRLVDYPMMAPIPEPSVQQWIYEVLKPAEADPEPHATMRHATRWFREHIRSIPSDRVLKEGEREELETWKRIAQDAEKERDEAQSAVARLLAWKRTILARMGALLDSATNARGAFSSDALRSQRAVEGGAE